MFETIKRKVLEGLRLLDKVIFANQEERLNTYKWFNKKFNKELVYNSLDYEVYK